MAGSDESDTIRKKNAPSQTVKSAERSISGASIYTALFGTAIEGDAAVSQLFLQPAQEEQPVDWTS